MVLAARWALGAAVLRFPHTPPRVGSATPSALAIDASGQPVSPGSQLCQGSLTSLPGQARRAAQAQHRLQLVHAEQPAHSEEGGVAEHEPGAERDDLRRERLAEPRVEPVPDPPRHQGERRGGDGHEDEGAAGVSKPEAAHPPPEEHEQRRRPGDVHERRRERDPPDPEPVEHGVQNGVQAEVPERDPARDPRGLEREEAAVQHQHRPVEREPERECGEAGRHVLRVRAGEVLMLVEEPHDRGRQYRCRHARRHEQEADQPQAGADGVLEGAPVLARRVARQEREEDGRHRDREHALRQHVEAKGPHDRRRRDVRVQVVRREQLVDQGVDVDQTEPDRHRHHQHERPLHRRVADVDHHVQPAVAGRAATATAGGTGRSSRRGSRPRRCRASSSPSS